MTGHLDDDGILPTKAEREAEERNKQERDLHDFSEAQTNATARLATFTKVLAVATILLALAAFWQGWTGKEAANAARSAADTASNTLKEMQEEQAAQENNFDRIMRQTTGQTAAQLQSARAAADSVTSGEKQMQLEQRPWVVFKDISSPPELGKPWNTEVTFTNTGRTPAINAQFSCIEEMQFSESQLHWYRAVPETTELLAPNGEFYCTTPTLPVLDSTKTVVDQGLLDSLASSPRHLFLYGSVRYADMFNRWSWMTFCWVLQPNGKEWNSCKRGGYTGNGKTLPRPFNGPKVPVGISHQQ